MGYVFPHVLSSRLGRIANQRNIYVFNTLREFITMGKNKNRNKKRARTQMLYEAARKSQKTIDEDDYSVEEQSCGVTSNDITDLELKRVIEILKKLTRTPDTLETFKHSKRFKELRRALHPVVLQQIKSYEKGTDYTKKVSVHLIKKEFVQALAALQACLDLQQQPKQGTIQRWVREADTCKEGTLKISLLSIILKLSGNGFEGVNKHDPRVVLSQAEKKYNLKNSTDEENKLIILDSWKIPCIPPTERHENDGESKQTKEGPSLSFTSQIVYQEKADERTPPNHYDLYLHYIPPKPSYRCIIPFDEGRLAETFPIPFVHGAMILKNVLSERECRYLIEVSSNLGYRPDHPKSLDSPTGIDSCEWLVDDSIHSIIFDRVKHVLPSSTMSILDNLVDSPSDESQNTKDNYILSSINRRWRCFRYGQSGVYRPHIDGSWPASYLSACGQKYESDKTGNTKSFLTFLIYLNDNFDGGETRFYYPRGKGMVARGVQPKTGCVLVFPQGNIASLLHEGAEVTKGKKYRPYSPVTAFIEI